MISRANLFNFAILLSLAFVWGSSFILMKIGLKGFSALELGSTRILIAALTLLPFALKAMRRIPKSAWKYLVVVGMCGNLLPAYLFATAQTVVPSAMSGMLNSTVPIFTLIYGLLWFGISIRKFQYIGIGVALVGSIMLFIPDLKDFDVNMIGYGSLIIVSTNFYAISLNTIARYLKEVRAVEIAALALLVVCPIPLVHLVFSGGEITQGDFALDSFVAIALLAIFGTALAIAFFNALVKRTSAVFSSTVTYLIPIVALFWGYFDGERIALIQLIGLAVVLGGIVLTRWQKRK